MIELTGLINPFSPKALLGHDPRTIKSRDAGVERGTRASRISRARRRAPESKRPPRGGLSEIRSGIFGLCLDAVGQWLRCIGSFCSRRFSASILPGVMPFFGDLACTVAISAVEPCDLRFSAPEFPMAATNRASHHVCVLLFLGLNHRLPLKASLPLWQAVKRSFDDFIHWAHKLKHGGLVRGFLQYSHSPARIGTTAQLPNVRDRS